MKQNGTLLNTRSIENFDIEEIGDEHLLSSIETPMRPDAFALEDDVKIELIEKHFRHIMEIMGLDLTDDSLQGTPKRVAKMYIKEVFSGLDPKNKPKVTLFDNKYKYNQMLVEKDIAVFSNCEHHFVPIYGKAHIAYISSGKVIGLSKLNRIVEYFSRRPQVQERLTVQIANELKIALQTEDVAVVVDAKHMCVQSRGVRDAGSSTVTSYYGGKFEEEATRKEFLAYLGM
ncbi:GTP cyclohydrolase I FolE [Dyadobacter sp. CY345]|uniref:GTP cyclohydrolase I FolE n=1 Tax=Dyadobacter sp. CY345 TaxID=2909335 RepID=UPI001F2D901F|nr:GTP cyclohydrolase I FolE [Dyadobacter sp. CY345]MCF2443889.1 GTP cyclohydrolase I FolE [Dyadobacter sp. CY345]